MSYAVISIEHITKQYDLGVIGSGTLTRDLNRWWARTRGKPDPYARIGQEEQFKRLGGSILALDDVSFKVQQGEALGIIGPNGAGKSTLLKILSRVTAPSSGIVKVKGRIGSLLEVGTGFHADLTGRENVFLNGAILGMRKVEVEKKLDEIIDFSGVEKFIDTPVKRYSTGMYVRLAFAVAAYLESEILVVDEVLAVGDVEFQKKCLGKMNDVAQNGRTVLFVSHNLGSIQMLCTKGVLINSGKVIFHGSVQEAIDCYLISIENSNDGYIEESKRSGIGLTKLSRIELTDIRGQKISLLQTGQSINLIFYFDGILQGVSLQFTIYDSNGASIATFDSSIIGSEDIVQSSLENKIICRIDEIPLVPGKYRINTALKTVHGVQDHIDGALNFKVERGQINGRLVREGNRYGNIHIKHLWKVPTR